MNAPMLVPCRCRCGATFDLAAVEPYARYSDATCFKTPCCGRDADDRTWVTQPYTRLGPTR